MCDKNNIENDNNNPSTLNIPSKPYIVTKENAKAFKRNQRKVKKQ